jgi:hypothetical protein
LWQIEFAGREDSKPSSQTCAEPTLLVALRGGLPILNRRELAATERIRQVAEIAGGIAAWEAAKLPVSSAQV